jgi:quercetin dioxygenase-like cupin family protein
VLGRRGFSTYESPTDRRVAFALQMKGTDMHRIMVAALAASAWIPELAVAQGQSEVPLAIRASDPSVTWGVCPAIFPGACEIAVLHGDPAKPNSDVMLRVGAGYELPRHRHSSAERMILLEGRLRVKYDGTEGVELTTATYAYGPAGLPHEAKCVSRSRCILFIAFEGAVDAELVPPRSQ